MKDIKYEKPNIKFEFNIFEHEQKHFRVKEIKVLGVYMGECGEPQYSVLMIFCDESRELKTFSENKLKRFLKFIK